MQDKTMQTEIQIVSDLSLASNSDNVWMRGRYYIRYL